MAKRDQDDYNEEHLRIYKELEATKTAKSRLITRLLHMFAFVSVILSYKILQQLFTVESHDSGTCVGGSRFGEKKVEFTLLAIIVIFLVFYFKLVVWPVLVAKLCSRKERQVNAVQKRTLEQYNKECEILTKLELAKLVKTPDY